MFRMYKTLLDVSSLHLVFWSSLKTPKFFSFFLTNFLVGDLYSTFCDSGILHHLVRKHLFLKYSENSKRGISFCKLLAWATRLRHIIFSICKPFESNLLEFLEYEKKAMAGIWCYNIDPAYKTNVMLLINFFTTLRQSCRNVTMRPRIVHILHSLQNWCNVDATL